MKEKIYLNDEQKVLAEKHMSLVTKVINRYIITNESVYGFEYDDLYQEGCILLCKAASFFTPERSDHFISYAEKVIVNGLRTYCRIMCGKQKRQYAVNTYTTSDEEFALDQIAYEYDWDKLISKMDVERMLHLVKKEYSGITRKGINAIELKAKGLSGSDIAKIYNVKPNVIGAWISRAVHKLKNNEVFMQYAGKAVEKS